MADVADLATSSRCSSPARTSSRSRRSTAAGAGSLIAVAELDGTRIVTDGTWKTLPGITATPPAGWNTPGFDDSAWVAATVTGAYGIAPWNQNVQTPPGPTVLRVASVQGFSVGPHDPDRHRREPGGEGRSRAVGTAGANGSGLTLTTPMTIVHAVGAPVVNLTNPDTGISFTPALDQPHAAGALVTGSGNNIAASDPSAGAAVTPRMIARLEITYTNGSTGRHRLGPLVADRVRRVRDGRLVLRLRLRRPPRAGRLGRGGRRPHRRPRSAVTAPTSAGSTPGSRRRPTWRRSSWPATRRRCGSSRSSSRRRVTNPAPGTYVFDFGQNFAGWPQLNLTDPGSRRHRDPDVAGRGAAGERVRPRRPGVARAERRPRHQHVQHVHGRRRRTRDVASRLPVLRDAVPPGHRACPRATP